MVDVELVQREVDVEDDAYNGRYDALGGGGLKVDELDDCGHCYVHQRHLVDLVHCRVDVCCVFGVPSLVPGEVGQDGEEPAEANQEHGHVDIVNKETSLAGSLETPVHCVSRKQKSLTLVRFVYLLRVSDLVLNSRRNESFGLI